MSTQDEIAARLRAAFVKSAGNRVGDPFVSELARQIAAARGDAPAPDVRSVGSLSDDLTAAAQAVSDAAAVRDAALEEAAKVCASLSADADEKMWAEKRADAASRLACQRISFADAARRIRALRSSPPPEPDEIAAHLDAAAIRDAALEEAIRVCGPDGAWKDYWDGQGVYYACAAAIAALRSSPPPEPVTEEELAEVMEPRAVKAALPYARRVLAAYDLTRKPKGA